MFSGHPTGFILIRNYVFGLILLENGPENDYMSHNYVQPHVDTRTGLGILVCHVLHICNAVDFRMFGSIITIY